MSVYAYTGLPGSGKSYSVVEHQVLPALKAKRRVVTNVALHFDKLREAFPEAVLVEFPTQKVAADPASLYEYVEAGSVLILDEVWRLFPAGLKANHVPEAFRKLLAEHRHMVDAEGNSCQIVLVTQDLAQISAFARQLVEQTFRTVKLTSVGLQKQYRVDVFNGPASGPNPPENGRIRQLFGTFNSSVWQYYQTHTMKADGSDVAKVNERAVDRRANILARPVLLFGALIGVAAIFWGGHGLYQRFGNDKQAQNDKQTSAVQGDPAAPARPLMPVHRSDEVKPSPVAAAVAGVATSSKSAAQLVGVIVNLERAEGSYALVKLGERVLLRPLTYCSDTAGWWRCDFPDLGTLSL